MSRKLKTCSKIHNESKEPGFRPISTKTALEVRERLFAGWPPQSNRHYFR
jgi:hypothetical protein